MIEIDWKKLFMEGGKIEFNKLFIVDNIKFFVYFIVFFLINYLIYGF